MSVNSYSHSFLFLISLENTTFLAAKTSSSELNTAMDESVENESPKMEVECIREFTDVDSGIENMEVEEIKEIHSPNEVRCAWLIRIDFQVDRLK